MRRFVRRLSKRASRGLVAVLVTGRILDDLRRVAGDVSFFDAVVAENGAHIWFPKRNFDDLLGQPPPQKFVQELRRRGLSVERRPLRGGSGRQFGAADFICDSRNGIPLLLLFNRGRLMVLPQGVSKGVGLRAALSALRLSVHNAIGIGDAENDHDLLAACEIGVAVGWGSKTLQESADQVLEGSGPAAVAGYLRRTMGELRAPARTHGTLPIDAGHLRRRLAADISSAGTKCDHRGRSAIREIVGCGAGVRADDPAGIFGMRDRPGRATTGRSSHCRAWW